MADVMALKPPAERVGTHRHRMSEPFAAAFAMGAHARLGGACSHGELPSELMQRVLEMCAALPRVPCGAIVVAPLAVPGTEAEFQAHVQDTRTRASNGLWVSAPFRFRSDPHPMYGEADYVDFDTAEQFVWYGSDDSRVALPDGQQSYFVVAKFDFSLPELAAGDDGMVDLSAVPDVFRAVAKMHGLRVPLHAYDSLDPGQYKYGLPDTEHGGVLTYKRIVQANHHTTLGDVWTAVADAEGWGACPESYAKHFPHATGDACARSHLLSTVPESDSDEDDPDDDEVAFYGNGGQVVECAWPCAAYR